MGAIASSNDGHVDGGGRLTAGVQRPGAERRHVTDARPGVRRARRRPLRGGEASLGVAFSTFKQARKQPGQL